VRVVRFWPAVIVVAVPVILGVGVFLRRYRGTDRTALALAVLVSIGLTLLCSLAWFQVRWAGRHVGRNQLRWAGFRIGAFAGFLAGPIAVGLLGVRWAIDQLGGPVGEQFLPALVKALSALALEVVSGIPVFAVLSMLLGALTGWAVAEIIAACCPATDVGLQSLESR